jgi:hypothetical protein
VAVIPKVAYNDINVPAVLQYTVAFPEHLG